jgi:Ca-activated chloride channel family protein
MRGEHELDPHGSDGFRQRGARQTAGTPARKRVGARPGLGTPCRVPRVVAAPADSMMLFRDVGERQEVRERPRDRHGGRDRQGAQLIGELFEGCRAAGVRAFCQRADLLDALEQRVAFVRAQGVAEQFAQQPHVLSQRFMGIVGHGQGNSRLKSILPLPAGHTMNRSALLAAALVAASLGAIAAAQQTQAPSFTTANRTVAIYATVTNGRGRLVPDLKRDDFAIDDNGKRQELTLFSNDVQPITLIMLLDRSSSMLKNFDLEERAAESFVREMGSDDKARIGSFSNHIQIDPPDFSSDRETLVNVLRTELQGAGPTPLWNAVDTGIDKLLLEQGRRVILVFTDGVDMPMDFSGHHKSLKDVMTRAEEKDVMVYAIGLAGENGAPSGTGDRRGGGMPGGAFGGLGGRGLGGYSGRPQAEQPDEGLPKIAAATGGGYFELTSPTELALTFSRVADELHHQYALGFAPEKLDGKMHDLAVHLSRPDLVARTRKRYLASKFPGSP